MKTVRWTGAFVAMTALAGCGDSAPKSGTGEAPKGTAAVASRSGGHGAPASGVEVHTVPSGTPLKLAFICNNSSNFWNSAHKGIQKAEEELGIKVLFQAPPDKDANVQTQNAYLENLISQGYHGVAISPIKPEAQSTAIDKAAKVMNVITQDSDAKESKRLAYVGTDNFEAGKVLGKEIARLLPQGGKMAIFVGHLSADNASERLRGIEAAIEGKNIQIVAKKEDKKDLAKAQSNVEDVLSTNPDINLLAGLWAYNPPSIAAALRSAKKSKTVFGVGFDYEEQTLAGIADGTLECTVAQKPFEFGYRSIKLLAELCTRGESAIPKGGVIDPGVELVTSKNVREFKERLDRLTK